MTTAMRLGLGIVSLAMPLAAYAAPANVTGITAIKEGTGVRVMWSAPSGTDVVAHRIFYSHASILSNNGLYDDFETVAMPANSHLLENLPPSEDLFISVLAVNAKGEESPYFTEEAKVTVKTTTSAPAASSASSAAMSAASTVMAIGNELRLLSAEAISSTGVLLRFTHPVTIPQNQALEAIVIERASGANLSMRRFIVEGSTVIVHTAKHESGAPYRVRIGDMITGKNPDGTVAPLASDQTAVLFMAQGTASTDSSASSTAAINRADVTQLRLRAQPENAKTYSVEATWQAAAGEITGYTIAQSTDGGLTYATPRVVSAQTTAVKINGVPAGRFGVLVKTTFADGTQSRGVAHMITLGAQSGVQPTVPGKLPDSGPVMWMLAALTGAFAGAMHLKDRTTRVNA